MKVLLFGAAAVCAAEGLFALDVGDCIDVQISNPDANPNITYSVNTLTATDLPGDLPTPIFWLDCARTGGWLFDGNVVTGIPSRVGTRRLVTGRPASGGNWTVTGAEFVTGVPALCGGAMLDFGEINRGTSIHPGFLFDNVEGEGNKLKSVGTVIAIYNSENGGGWFLAGGGLAYAGADELGFIRATPNVWYDPLSQSGVGFIPTSVRSGIYRHDGLPTNPTVVGFNGSWETISFQAYSKNCDYVTGIGANDTRANYVSGSGGYWHGGGMRIAEMVFFDQILTHAQCARVENYLKAKWFGRSDRGYNGNAAVAQIRSYRGNQGGALQRIEAHAAAGETLMIERLYGGRDTFYGNKISGNPGIDKTGAGTLTIGDFAEYCGEIRVKEGSLAFARRALPTALPDRAYVRFDAQETESMTVTADGQVTEWRNVESLTGTDFSFGENTARPIFPKLIPNAFGTGMPTLDFGAFSMSGASFKVKSNGTDSPFKNIVTVIAVLGVQEGGGHLGDNGSNFDRKDDNKADFTYALVKNAAIRSVDGNSYSRQDGTFFVDGVKWSGTAGYDHVGYHVVALQVPGGCNLSALGFRASGDFSGGLRVSEFAAYNRVLSEDELRDASAYLMNKWMGRRAPGYAAAADTGVVDVQEVQWANPSGGAIDVPAGATVRINKFSITGPLEKTGGGTLVLGGGSRDAGDYVTVSGGKVVFAHPDPSAQCEMAAGPAFHLDASDTNLIETVKDGDGNDRVRFWYGKNFRNFVCQNETAQAPWLKPNALNGKPVVDLGDARPYGEGCYMNFGVPMEAIRSVFVVWKTSAQGGILLGSSYWTGWRTNFNCYDFIRGSSGDVYGILQNNAAMQNTYAGDIYFDGVKGNGDSVPSCAYEIVDVHTKAAGAHASALGIDRFGPGLLQSKQGGQSYAEIIIYNRTLSERERVATRNYLRKKWFPDAALEELPAAPAADPDHLPRRFAEVDATGGITFESESDTVVRALVGEGDVVKTGSGKLSVTDMSAFEGAFAVKEGTLELTGIDPGPSASFVESGRIFHADALAGVETVVNSKDVTEVVKWTSRHDPSYTAEPGYDAEGKRPTVRSYDGVGSELVVIDMAPNAEQCFRFCKDGTPIHLDTIKSAFWVIGSQYGGGFLLGGGNPMKEYDNPAKNYNFMRGPSVDGSECDRNPSAALLSNTSADWTLRNYGNWYLNGLKVDTGKVGLSGDWDLVSMTIQQSGVHTDAEGFAFDGRLFNQAGYAPYVQDTIGNQRLAEVILYDRALTAEERLQNESYLRNKWRIRTRKAATNAAAVDLAAGATLDCGGTKQYVAALTGAGTVQNGILEAGALVADADATAWPMVTGTFSVAAGVTVDLRNLSIEQDGANEYVVKILQASAFEGLENLSAVNVVGTAIPPDYKVRLIVRDGWLCLKVRSGGMVILLR